ncbi:MAG: HU family DNA-binding protein [bacterium]
MNKLELIDRVAEKLDVSKKEASQAVECVFRTITERLVAGEKVNIGSFGAFKMKKRAPRTGVNPRTGGRIQIGETRVASFRASKTLKDTLKRGKIKS